MINVEATRHPIPFRYPGGKHYAINLLRPFWQSVIHDEYREPFAGGASVFFNKPLATINWLNDIDTELMTTYRVMSNHHSRKVLLKLMSKEVASKERWKDIYAFKPNNDIETAYKYFYLNRTSFSGKLVSAAWGYRPKRSLPPERWHERIIPCGLKLNKVQLTSVDFETIITAPAKGNKVLMYIDPPYYAPPKRKHYRNGFDLADHHRLADCLRKTQHQFMLTYDAIEEVKKLYKWAFVYEARFFYRVDNSNIQNGNRKIGFELIITNYERRDWVSNQYELPIEKQDKVSVSA